MISGSENGPISRMPSVWILSHLAGVGFLKEIPFPSCGHRGPVSSSEINFWMVMAKRATASYRARVDIVHTIK